MCSCTWAICTTTTSPVRRGWSSRSRVCSGAVSTACSPNSARRCSIAVQPLAYIWDDHDYGDDNSDGNSPTRDAVRLYYGSDFPHYPLPLAANADGPIAQAFDIGRVRFLMTDTRSERLADQHTMLGPRQLEWLFAELERATRDAVPLVAWINTVPWITVDGDLEGWGQFAAERRLIGERVAALGLGPRLLMLSGDAHMLAIDDGRNNRHGGFVVAHAAPLDRFLSRKGGPYSASSPPISATASSGFCA